MAYFLSFLCILALSFASPAYASKTYTVKKGDTLNKIAESHHLSVPSLMKANHLSSSKLQIGSKLVIPGKEIPAKKTAKTVKKEDPSPKSVKGKASGEIYHTVRKGDTLYAIAKKYSLSLQELRELNNSRKDSLKPGLRLLVKRAERAPEKEPEMQPEEADDAITYYQVKKGDTLAKIARSFNMDVNTLSKLNELGNSSITAGQKLIVGYRNQDYLSGTEEETDDAAAEEPDRAAVMANPAETVTEADREQEDLANMGVTDRLILFAKKMLHFPYRFGGNGSFGIDCSAYVKKVYGLVGLELPRSAREQFKVGEKVEKNELSVGDLVFFRTYASFPSHVGIYLGNNLFIHASSKAKKVTINSLNAPYYLRRFIGAKRLLSDEDKALVEKEILTVK